MALKKHIPGQPNSPEPKELGQLATTLKHPLVNKVGVTTTEEGKWALLVTVKQNAQIPIKEIEGQSSKFPIIYQEDAGRLSMARPAYPALGE